MKKSGLPDFFQAYLMTTGYQVAEIEFCSFHYGVNVVDYLVKRLIGCSVVMHEINTATNMLVIV